MGAVCHSSSSSRMVTTFRPRRSLGTLGSSTRIQSLVPTEWTLALGRAATDLDLSSGTSSFPLDSVTGRLRMRETGGPGPWPLLRSCPFHRKLGGQPSSVGSQARCLAPQRGPLPGVPLGQLGKTESAHCALKNPAVESAGCLGRHPPAPRVLSHVPPAILSTPHSVSAPPGETPTAAWENAMVPAARLTSAMVTRLLASNSSGCPIAHAAARRLWDGLGPPATRRPSDSSASVRRPPAGGQHEAGGRGRRSDQARADDVELSCNLEEEAKRVPAGVHRGFGGT